MIQKRSVRDSSASHSLQLSLFAILSPIRPLGFSACCTVPDLARWFALLLTAQSNSQASANAQRNSAGSPSRDRSAAPPPESLKPRRAEALLAEFARASCTFLYGSFVSPGTRPALGISAGRSEPFALPSLCASGSHKRPLDSSRFALHVLPTVYGHCIERVLRVQELVGRAIDRTGRLARCDLLYTRTCGRFGAVGQLD